MILDANILLFAVDNSSPHNQRAKKWLESTLNSNTRVGLPYSTIGAFVRISTHPRVYDNPLAGAQAWRLVQDWMRLDNVWVPSTSERTVAILGDLVQTLALTANLIPDAQLAALAIENGVAVVSADSDFARFPDCPWINPLVD